MSKKKAVLGRGLSALLNNSDNIESAKQEGAEKLVGQIIEIPISQIETNPYQPRTHFNEEALADLSQSIKELGVIQPITVRKNKSRFELISGERRLRASGLAGLKSIPAYIRLADDQEMLEMALVENIQRQDLDPIEIALSYERLLDEINLTQEELSKRVGKDRSTISNYLRLLKLDPIIQNGIRDGVISMGHGKALTSLETNELQLEAYHHILQRSYSVRNTEKYIQNLKEFENGKTHLSEPDVRIPDQILSAKKSMSKALGNKVEVKIDKKGKGKLIIYFESDKDFDYIQKKILTKD